MSDANTPKDNAEALDAAKRLLEWSRKGGVKASRMRSPDGATIVVVEGKHRDCLDTWYDEHFAAESRKTVKDASA